MNTLLGLPILATFMAFTAVPLFWLDGGRVYLEVVLHHPLLVCTAALAWGWIGYWLTRRAAEVLLLRRSGTKLRIDA